MAGSTVFLGVWLHNLSCAPSSVSVSLFYLFQGHLSLDLGPTWVT